MRFGLLILPDDRWSVTRPRWEAAEELGFDHAWTYDHLTWRSLRDTSWFGALPTLTAAALATSRLRLGTLVASPNFRHPVPFAKELMTLDDISAGRLTVGFGAGGSGFDAHALGQQEWGPAERAERFEEFLILLDRLLSQRETDVEGRHYSARGARSIPGCTQQPRPPFAIAADGPRGMRLAALLGQSWVTLDHRVDAARVARFERCCEEVGRDPASLDRLVLLGFRERPLESVETFRASAQRLAELGFTDLVVHWPREQEPFAAQRRVLDQVAAELPSMRSLGPAG
jgi:alkanesulfonate monooxygenase SsuD/methylene tetrahydromethanopterin reductase-like flavin-dependent oxidoreductase (luciferase family)